MDIIELAYRVVARVSRYADQARRFFYQVVLSDHACSKCGGQIGMTRDGWCQCSNCGDEFDPTLAFQTCLDCGGKPKLAVRRYQCVRCGKDIASRFMFDGLVFDAAYFRRKMAEHRQEKKRQEERVRKMLADSRSSDLDPLPADLGSVPGLMEALNSLTKGSVNAARWKATRDFDMRRYQSHLRAHTGPIAVEFEQIPVLMQEDLRLDRIWRFIAAIFMANAGLIQVDQHGPTLMVRQCEAYRKGQDVSGELEEVDRVQGLVG